MYKIVVINLGSTSTKLAYYEDKACIKRTTIEHPVEEIAKFTDIMEQHEYRKEIVEDFLKTIGVVTSSLDVIVSRGGHTKPVIGGVYLINEEMLEQQESKLYGNHPCDLGSGIAYEICKTSTAIPLVVDPPITDEFEPVARLSGHPLISRRSSFHALSHKATARRYARERGLNYEEINVVVAHLGGGISIAAHKKGCMVDGDNGLDGDGPFSTNRTGALPVGDLVKLCYSGEYTYEEMKKMLNGQGGLMAYLGIADVKAVELNAKTDEYSALCLDGMIYQICKQIGAMSTVLNGDMEAILLTGGISYSKYVVSKIKQSCEFIAPVVVYAGENEMDSLAHGAYAALKKETKIMEI